MFALRTGFELQLLTWFIAEKVGDIRNLSLNFTCRLSAAWLESSDSKSSFPRPGLILSRSSFSNTLFLHMFYFWHKVERGAVTSTMCLFISSLVPLSTFFYLVYIVYICCVCIHARVYSHSVFNCVFYFHCFSRHFLSHKLKHTLRLCSDWFSHFLLFSSF